MAYLVLRVQVPIASPGDTAGAGPSSARRSKDWDARTCEEPETAFQPRTWERDVVGDVGEHPQSSVSRQSVAKAAS